MGTDFFMKKDEFKEYYLNNLLFLSSSERVLRSLISQLLLNSEIIENHPKLIGRVKDKESCIEKFGLKYRKDLEKKSKDYHIKDYITDIIGLRVICIYESDIHLVVDILKENFELISETDKTAELEKKIDVFGYKGVHLDLKMKEDRLKFNEYIKFDGITFEVQVRSIVQDAWSEIDHKIKYKKTISDNIKRRIISLSALFELADREFDSIKRDTKQEIQNMSIGIDVNDVIDALNIQEFLHKMFDGAVFEDYKIEGFVNEIITYKKIKIKDFQEAFSSQSDTVDKYRKYRMSHGDTMNPYTFVRHVLYSYDNRTFHSILFDNQRNNYTKWISSLK